VRKYHFMCETVACMYAAVDKRNISLSIEIIFGEANAHS